MNRIIYKISLLTLAGAGCVASLQSCTGGLDIDDPNVIKLSAYMGYHPTKGTAADDSGIRDYDYAEPLDITLVRIDENEASTCWPNYFGGKVPLAATMSAPDGDYKRDIEFETAQFYRNSSDHIRFASWYPRVSGTAYNSSAEKTTVTFDVDGATDVLYGTIAEGSKTGGFEDVVFNHALCQFNIYAYTMESADAVGGDSGSGEDELIVDWGKVEHINVNNFLTRCVMTLPQDDDGKVYTFEYDTPKSSPLQLSAADNGIYWNPGESIPLGFSAKKLVASYISAPPTSGYISLAVNTDKQAAYQQVSIARNFQQGCAYDIVLRFTSHGLINAEVSVGNWNYQGLQGGEKITQDVAADMYYDLSSYKTANSYIVPSGNYGYSFKANVKGNSSEAIDPGYIDILWCDNTNIWDPAKKDNTNAYKADGTGGNYLQLVSHQLSQNRVIFKIGDIKNDTDKELKFKGNAVVAAYDKQGGNIIWSWHLWFTDRASTVGFTNGYLALNMDLGATAVGGEGLYYQWGRKDPFKLGSGTSYFTKSSSKVSVEQSIQNPTVFYGTGTGNTWYSGALTDMKSFWGWVGDSKDIAKSMYDPCPPGYFVSDYRIWGSDNIGAYEQTYNAGVSATVEIANRAYTFPLTMGYLGADGTKKTDVPMFLWSASLDESGTTPYSLQYTGSKTTPAVSEEHRNYAGAVRCIAKAKSTVKNLSSPQTANSYIVSKDGYYKFNATVGGNGVSTLISSGGEEWDITGKSWGNGVAVDAEFQPDSVTYLWYQPALNGTIPTSLKTSDLCLKMIDKVPDDEGYVSFQVRNWTPCNFVLAAYKGGKIKWSWHIWLTDINDCSGTYCTVMDRNLGATSAGSSGTNNSTDAIATYGFLYQWGRKDPIIGPSNSTVSSASSTASSDWFSYSQNGGTWTRQGNIKTLSGPVTIKGSTENPDCMILGTTSFSGYYTGSTSKTMYHWMADFRGNEGSNTARKQTALWGYAISDSSWGVPPGKTCYDPCPPGYMVPHMWMYWGGSGQDNATTSSSSNYTTYTYGATCNYLGNAWFPYAGMRNPTTGYASGAGSSGSGYYTTSLGYGGGGRVTVLGSSWYGLYNNTADYSDSEANAHSLRCVKQ